ncbi:hypothetical protein FHS21_000579 [Phyllobacterium trifolii]|uniref:Lipoprotein n=1 Tax=Phyllobacterium trifolii TaxID=300193 RepID=A0A839TZX2_9HYPH|nr:hypothetical protein [Phyllobacterium trifolii]
MRPLAGLTVLLTLLITGCVSMTPEERRALDNQTCSSYGFRRGTDAFANCLLNLDLDRRAASRAQFEQMQFNTPLIIYDNRYRYYRHRDGKHSPAEARASVIEQYIYLTQTTRRVSRSMSAGPSCTYTYE